MGCASVRLDSTKPRARPRIRLWGVLLAMVMVSLCLFGISPQWASAHASLTNSTPSANAELAQSPSSVVLTFNERLEEGVFYIKVFDSKQKQVTSNKAKLNETHTAVELELPRLETGNYIVTYHVISADGHPIEGTYLFAVGQSLSQPGSLPSTNMEHLHSHGLSKEMGIVDIATFITRILYYITMLLFTGWVMWLRFGQSLTGKARPLIEGWAVQLQRGYLIAFLLFMFSHIYALIGDGGPEAMAALFTSTGSGFLWLASLAWSLLGFVLLFRNA